MFRTLLTTLGSLFNDSIMSHSKFSASVRRKYFIDEFDSWMDTRDKSRLEKDLLIKSFAAVYDKYDALAGPNGEGDWPAQLIKVIQVRVDEVAPRFFWDKDAEEVTKMFFDELLTSTIISGTFDSPAKPCRPFLQEYILAERPDVIGRYIDRFDGAVMEHSHPELWCAWQSIILLYENRYERMEQMQQWVDTHNAATSSDKAQVTLPQDLDLS